MNAIKTKPRYLVAMALAAGLMLAGCRGESSLVPHKLVATTNEHSVPMYPDEQTYLKVSRMQQQGGVEGMAGDLRKNFSTKDIDDRTPVMILSSDENGAVVQIAEGPMKGQMGFVARQNVD
jgi:hypothetical protein